MSHFRVGFGVVQRSKGGSALRRSAYQRCATAIAPDGTRYDYTETKDGEHVATLMCTPDGSPEWTRAPDQLWARAEAAEKRRDAQPGRTLEFSIPRAVSALGLDAEADFCRSIVAPWVSDGMCWQLDIQTKPAADGGTNRHCHGLATMRRLDPSGPQGFAAKKATDWNTAFAGFQAPPTRAKREARSASAKRSKTAAQAGQSLRAELAARMSAWCAAHGVDYTADPRRNAERGHAPAEPHVPDWCWTAKHRLDAKLAAGAIDHAQHQARMPAAVVRLEDFRARRAELARIESDRRALDAEITAIKAEAVRLDGTTGRSISTTQEPTHHDPAASPDNRHSHPLDGPGGEIGHGADSRPAVGGGTRGRGPHRPNPHRPGEPAGGNRGDPGRAHQTARRCAERVMLISAPAGPRDARLAAALASTTRQHRPPAVAPPTQQRPTGHRLLLATTDPEQARQQQAAFRRRMDAANKTPDGRAAALREAYGLEGWMPKSVLENIERIDYDATSGRVGLRLRDGTRIVDDGSRVSLVRGQLTTTAADEMLAAVQRRGWTAVTLTGDDQFKNAMALRMALAEPPVAVAGHTLPPELQKRLEAELASRRQAADRQQPAPEVPPVPPPRPEAAAAAWLHGRATERRYAAAKLIQAREDALDHGARLDRAASDALFALDGAERALVAHRAAGQPGGVVARLSGRTATWQEEERRLDAARIEAEAELDRLRQEKRHAHLLAAQEAAPLQRQAEEQRRQAEALERVAVAARCGDPRACTVAARQDDEAALRLAEQLLLEHEQEERRRRAQREAELASQRQQGLSPGPAPSPRRR